MRNKLLGILVGGALAATASNASAAPMLAIDLDLGTAGIQSSLSFVVGTAPASISAAVVAWDTAAPTAVGAVEINVTSSAIGTAALGPVTMAGPFAGAMSVATDTFSATPTAPGVPLTPGVAPSAGSLGTVGYFAAPIFLPPPGPGLPPIIIPGVPGVLPVDAAIMPTMFVGMIDFTIIPGLTVGTSTFMIGSTVPGGTLFDPMGFPLSPGLATASLTLTPDGPMVMPEPTSMILFGAGLLGLAGLRRRRKVS